MSNKVEFPKPTRRSFLASAAGVALAGAVPSGAQVATEKAPLMQAKKKPLNVLFFMSDDMRPELACYGSRFHAHSPNIDALAAKGVRFDRNYCQFPLCNPSRASLFSGRPPHTTGVLGNSVGLRDLHTDWTTLPQLFREHGYTTLRSGKLFHAGFDDHKAWTDFDGEVESMHPTQVGKRLPIPRVQVAKPDGSMPPLPESNERGDHSDQLLVLTGNGEGAGDYLVADRAIKYLNECKDKPFFIGCGFSKPHSPPEAPQRFYDLYNAKSLQLPPDFAAWPTVPPGFPKAAIRPKNADLFIGRGASPEEAQQVIRAYLASISWADWNLGRVVAELDRLGLRDNTLIVFVADHGYQLGEKGKWSKAGSLFEGGTRIPLIIHMPGAAGNGRASTRIVQSLDIYKTVAELAGLPVPAEIEGESLVPLLTDPRAAWDRPAYSVWSEDGKTIHGTMVRTEQLRYAEFGPKAVNGAMMFDVHADPLELKNIVDDPKYAEERKRLSRLIAEYGVTG
ncbi:Arylsulfatase A [Granulicella rosea]|uniref:Arylsulfatase A n=1 Tax=Granulicella rosea TaxID=474952 RepID=A0A239D5X1_9BACT|nr:sulfatase [Granulicella rosea]SNS27669.1 Arylsulfatase A [Granulicella rosea]